MSELPFVVTVRIIRDPNTQPERRQELEVSRIIPSGRRHTH
jgi:hypothetical protein